MGAYYFYLVVMITVKYLSLFLVEININHVHYVKLHKPAMFRLLDDNYYKGLLVDRYGLL